MFGIVVGIASVMFIMSLGDFLNQVITKAYPCLYGNINNQIWIYVTNNGGNVECIPQKNIDSFVEQHEKEIDTYLRSSNYTYSGKFVIDNQKYSKTEVVGVSQGYDDYCNLIMVQGRFINEEDCRKRRSSIVISDIAAKNCFGNESPIGKNIELKSNTGEYIQYVVVGVYKYVSSVNHQAHNINAREIQMGAFTSYTYHDMLKGQDNYKMGLQYFVIIPDKNMSISQLNSFVNEAYQYYYKMYGKNYTITSQLILSNYDDVSKISTLITLIFLVISSIALLVGGIGVMNTLFISVTERTREIGIRKALGAKNSYIFLQFISESIILCTVAGVIGIIGGCILDKVYMRYLPAIIRYVPNDFWMIKPFILSEDILMRPTLIGTIVSVGFIILTGIIFGMVPALKAAKMSPVDALRDE